MGGARLAGWLATALLILALAGAGPATAAGVYHCQSYDNSWTYSGNNSSYEGYVAMKGNQPQGTALAPNSCWDMAGESWGFGFSLKNVTGSTLGAPASIQWVGLTLDFYDNADIKVHSIYIPGSDFSNWFDESFQDLSHGIHTGDPVWLDPDDLCAACFCTHYGSRTPGRINLTWAYEIYLYVTTTYALVENSFTLSDPGVGKWYKVNIPSGLDRVRFLLYSYSNSVSGWANSGSRFYRVNQAEFTIGTASEGSWHISDWYGPNSGYTYIYVSDSNYGGSSQSGDYTISPSAGSGELKVQYYCDDHGSPAVLDPDNFVYSVDASPDGEAVAKAYYSVYVPSGTNYMDVNVNVSDEAHSFFLTAPGGTVHPKDQGTFSGSVETGCWKLTLQNTDTTTWTSTGTNKVYMYSGNQSSEQTEADYNNNGKWETSIELSSSQ